MDSYRGRGGTWDFPPKLQFPPPPKKNFLGKINKRVNTCCNSLLFITKSRQLKLTSNYVCNSSCLHWQN